MRDLGFDNTAIEHLKKLFPTKTIELMANEVEVENITTQAKKVSGVLFVLSDACI